MIFLALINMAFSALCVQDVGLIQDAPIALVVITPGVDLSSYQGLFYELESNNLDAWAVTLPLNEPLPENADQHIAEVLLPNVVTQLRIKKQDKPIILVGHGFGGTLALMSAPYTKPEYIATMGALLEENNYKLFEWFSSLEVPTIVDPNLPLNWNNQEAVTLALGIKPNLERLSGIMVKTYQKWLKYGPSIEWEKITMPTLLCVGALDRISPPESVHKNVKNFPKGEFVRFGLLRRDPSDPGHGEMLLEKRYQQHLARWIKNQVK